MAHLDLAGIGYTLPDGRPLLDGVDLRVGAGARVALIGPNGSGKTTLMRIATKELTPHAGSVTLDGETAVMAQWVTAGTQERRTVADLLVAHAPARLRDASQAVTAAEEAMMLRDDEAAQLAYATALADWADVGGYQLEAVWDEICTDVLAQSWDRAQWRPITELSGGEVKRVVLSAMMRSGADILILDEPDNALDVPAKRWLERQLNECGKSVLFISHDRQTLAAVATHVVTLEPGAAGSTAWVHGGGFAGYADARQERMSRLAELRRRWDEEHAKLKALVQLYKQKAAYNSDMASRLQAARSRLAAFEKAGPPQQVTREQNVTMRLRGSRTAKRAIVFDQLALTGLTEAFDAEIWFGDRVAVLGANGTGKSHLLRLLAGGGSIPEASNAPVSEVVPDPVAHTGTARLGSRVRPGWFAQQAVPPHLAGRTLVEVLHRGDGTRSGMPREEAGRVLDRYGLAASAEQQVQTLSGGQVARLQILLLELSGATLLLLDEPTDNLDLHSAQALDEGLASFEGTVVAITHDRWLARSFDHFLIVGSDGQVRHSEEPVWDDDRGARVR